MFRHPAKVCMSYKEHMKFSLYLSFTFAKASYGALIHAFIPDIYETHSTDYLEKINKEIKSIGCRSPSNLKD